ncbi:cytidine deaminase-like [Tubulanus polymorphus]|uniref:cytidine deaminase-like n=1 Tax=Tubulanus polymorphus TaxID=672921 RepID=UPI003DA4ED47
MAEGKFSDLSAVLQKLVTLAIKTKDAAYCPYSNFRVGAAVLCEDGSLQSGCNVENASYGLTICAERVAVTKACSEGHRKFKAIAVAADIAGKYVGPCGACRQVCIEFGSDWDMYLVDPESLNWKLVKVGALLPFGFKPEDLE